MRAFESRSSAAPATVAAVLSVILALAPGCSESSAPGLRGEKSAERYRGADMEPEERGLAELIGSDDTELWVVVKSDQERRPDHPGSGALLCLREGRSEEPVGAPLEHTDVKASVQGFLGTVDVTQVFRNPYAEAIEATYVFPLPTDAAVSDFLMSIGERRIRGVVREREEAERIYAAAKAEGRSAALLSQERPNVFAEKVAGILPSAKVEVKIRYHHRLEFRDGAFEFVFPMVVGPRFNPPGFTQGIAAVATGSGVDGGQPVAVPYLREGERLGHDIAIALNWDTGLPIRSIVSPTHDMVIDERGGSRLRMHLAAHESIPNADLVVRVAVAGDRPEAALLTHEDARGGFFSLFVVPPTALEAENRRPSEMIFVLDCSGSMSGRPIELAKRAIAHGIDRLDSKDAFQIVRFSDSSSSFGDAPIAATSENRRRAKAWLSSVDGEGGTMMIEGIKTALDFPQDEGRDRIVSFMTDGFIGNEAEIFRAIAERLGRSRIFSFGVGSSVNRHLLEGMARLGRGAVAWIGLDSGSVEEVDAFYEQIRHPALEDVELDFGGARVAEVYPKARPDLFIGRPIHYSGRFAGPAPTRVKVRGRVAGRPVEYELHSAPVGEKAGGEAIAFDWARSKIADLETAWAVGREDLGEPILATALQFGLVSCRTSFVAVDALGTPAAEGPLRSVPVPVALPKGVSFDASISGR